jgi:hypothetical protein
LAEGLKKLTAIEAKVSPPAGGGDYSRYYLFFKGVHEGFAV